MEDRNGRIEFDPIFTIGIIGKCKIETIQDIKDFFQLLKALKQFILRQPKAKNSGFRRMVNTK